ncbi:MAG TPA: carbohydrate ABC transporter permease [Chloroflexota bacterium]
MSAIPTSRRTAPRLKPALLYAAAMLLTFFMLAPLWLIFVAAFSPEADVYAFPKLLYPAHFSTDTLNFFINSAGVKPSFGNSVKAGIGALLLALVLGAPAGYAVARFSFPGRNILQLVILATRSFPALVLSIPLAVSFLTWGLFDTVRGVALVHTAFALPTTVLITSAVFYGVPRDLEEAALTLGCTPLGAFRRISLPLALPGLAAAALFTFVLSWNEVFAATILTQQNRTLPAQVLSTLGEAPLQYQFAGGFMMIVPSLLFIFIIRRYLVSSWGTVSK